MSVNLKETYESNIKRLEQKLNGLYTIEAPEDYKIMNDEKSRFNFLEQLEITVKLEEVYSAVENGDKKSPVYDEYSEYLKKIRNDKSVLQREVTKIEEEKGSEINDINILLESFKEALKNLK